MSDQVRTHDNSLCIENAARETGGIPLLGVLRNGVVKGHSPFPGGLPWALNLPGCLKARKPSLSQGALPGMSPPQECQTALAQKWCQLNVDPMTTLPIWSPRSLKVSSSTCLPDEETDTELPRKANSLPRATWSIVIWGDSLFPWGILLT